MDSAKLIVHKNGGTAVYSCLWLQSRSVLGSFGVVLMSCKVNFHVVRSALRNSMCLLFSKKPKQEFKVDRGQGHVASHTIYFVYLFGF